VGACSPTGRSTRSSSLPFSWRRSPTGCARGRWRLAREGELRQELLERGLDPRAVKRAVRYGRAQELAGRR